VVSRKRRLRVVFDTNVFVAAYLSRKPNSPNAALVRWWRTLRRLELVVCDEVASEYLEILERLGVDSRLIARFDQRLKARETVTWINLGRRVVASRDPDDNVFLSTAQAGRADYLVSNDRDLLDLDERSRKRLKFQIVSPQTLLDELTS
jgi:uncharacterized protein